MTRVFFPRRRWRQALTLLLIAGALTSLFPPPIPAFEWWAAQAVYLAVGYLALGLSFLFFGKIRLMFVCFGCSAAICLFQLEIAAKQPNATGGQLREQSEVSRSPGNPPGR